MKHKYMYVFIVGILLQLTLVYAWFHNGFILAAGEGGILFYNFDTIIKLFGNSWFPVSIGFPGTGLPLTNLPFFSLLGLLAHSGFSYLFLQESFFFIMQATGMFSMYFLAEQTLSSFSEKKKILISTFASLFYVFNQINIVIVLNRFIYEYVFFYALLPLFLLIVIHAMKRKSYWYIFLLQTVLFIFSPTFSSFPSVMIVWTLFVCVTVYHFVFQSRNRKTAMFLIGFFVSNLALWLLINSWWVLPFIKVIFGSTYISQVAYTPTSDLTDLTSLSGTLGNLSYVFRLMHHDYYIWMKDVFHGFFQNPLIILLSFLPTVFVFSSLLVKKKFSYFYFFMFMAILCIFFVKGTSGPFGMVFYFLFTHTRLLEEFRNPFEKIGILLPLFFAIPFGYGIISFYEYIQKKFSSFQAFVSLALSGIVCFIILCFPLWNGQVFVGSTPPGNNPKLGDSVQVPLYYKNANAWLNKNTDDFRVIALPIGGEGITYTWKYPYGGVEVSNGLFSKSFISYCTTIQFLCENTQSLQPLLMEYPQDFWKVFPPLNARFLMLRKDTNFFYDQMQNPLDLEQKINEAGSLQKTASFGPLTFYAGDSRFNTPKIFAATEGITALGTNSFISLLPLANMKQNDIYFTDKNVSTETLSHSRQILLQANEFVPSSISISPENALDELPYVRNLPGSRFYIIGRIREEIDNFMLGNSSFPNREVQSDKRLVEVYKLLLLGKQSLANTTMQSYAAFLPYFEENINQFNDNKSKEDMLRQQVVMQKIIALKQGSHEKNNLYTSSQRQLDVLLKNLSLVPPQPIDLTLNRAYVVNVPQEGNYTAFLATKSYSPFYNATSLQGNIDNVTSFSTKLSDGDFTTLGTFHFAPGQHQINLHALAGNNLIQKSEITLLAKKLPNNTGVSSNTYEIPVTSLNPFARYQLSFDYNVSPEEFPHLFIQVFFEEDTDQIVDGKVTPHYIEFIHPLIKEQQYHFTMSITPYQIAHAGKIIFTILPENNCLDLHPTLVQQCKDRNFNKQFDIQTKVEIQNLSFTRSDMGSLILVKDNTIVHPYRAPTAVSYKEVNPARYIITVKGAKGPFYLSFLEAFDPLWTLSYVSGGHRVPITQKNHILINSYANMWVISKTGNCSLLLEFSPQNLLELGIKISTLSLILLLGMWCMLRILLKRRKH